MFGVFWDGLGRFGVVWGCFYGPICLVRKGSELLQAQAFVCLFFFCVFFFLCVCVFFLFVFSAVVTR